MLALLALMTACNYEVKKTADGGEGAFGLPPGAIPSYAQVNDAVLAGKCATCHGVAGGNRGGLNFESHGSVAANAAAIAAAVNAGSMPPRTAPALSAGERELLLGWIAAGAPLEGREGVANPAPQQPDPQQPGPTPPLPELTFASVYERVLQPACASCHGTRGGVNVETYDAVLDHKHDIVEVIEKGSMPPRSRAPLTAEQKEHLLAWIRAGAPFN
jgi:uncharacterized membrane protein